MTASLSRKQRRVLARVAADVDRVTAADRRYFERRPGRTHRLRLMATAERTHLEAIGGPLPPQPDGIAWFCLVKKLTLDVRLRAYVGAPGHLAGDDHPEAHIRAAWEEHARRTPAIAEREAMMVAALQPGGSLHDLYSRGDSA